MKNEIDVIALEGYTPIFISCKNGNVDKMAFYELDTVAKRFGGKYVKKEFSTGSEMNESSACRAKEMNILPVMPKSDALD